MKYLLDNKKETQRFTGIDLEKMYEYDRNGEVVEINSKDVPEDEENEEKIQEIRELAGLDKDMQKIQGALAHHTAELDEAVKNKEAKEKEIKEKEDEGYPEDDLKKLRSELTDLDLAIKTHEEKIYDLKMSRASQINSIKDSLSRLIEGKKPFRRRIIDLFREQGITIASILTAVGMVLAFLIESLLPKGKAAVKTPKGGDGGRIPGKEWLKKKLKALSDLFKRLAIKATDALPGLIGSIVAWILNRAKEAVGWLSQNMWALIVGVGGLIYTYLMTRNR